MDKEFCRQQARLVRSLADQADPFIKRRLLQLAEHYERRLLSSKSNDGKSLKVSEQDVLPSAPPPSPATKAASNQPPDQQEERNTDQGVS
jgi:hypothetical protein